MTAPQAEALAEFRRFNYDHIYLRPASQQQGAAVVRLLRALVDHYGAHPDQLPEAGELEPGSDAAVHAAVAYVGGMTARSSAACAATSLLATSPNSKVCRVRRFCKIAFIA